MDSGKVLLLFFRPQVALCASHVVTLSTCPCFCTQSCFLRPISLGCPFLSPDAKFGFPICDTDEDRGGLLHFKSNWEASGTVGAAAEGTGYWDRKLPANRLLSVWVCVCLAGISESSFLLSLLAWERQHEAWKVFLCSIYWSTTVDWIGTCLD